MQIVKIEISICLNKNGSAGLRSYLVECGFELFWNDPMTGHSLKPVKKPVRFDEDGKLDDGATFIAYYNGEHDPKEWPYLRNQIKDHLSVTEFLYVMKRVEAPSDEIPD